MDNRMVIEVAGYELNIISDQTPETVTKTAAFVQDKMLQMMGGNKTSAAVAAILTAMNITEELENEAAVSDRLRGEITAYAREIAAYQKKAEEREANTEFLQKELENLKVDYQIRESAIQALEEKKIELQKANQALEEIKRSAETTETQSVQLKHQLAEWKSKWEAADRELSLLRRREQAAAALGEELAAVRREAENHLEKYRQTAGELEQLRLNNEVREEEYQKALKALESENAEYREMLDELTGESVEEQQGFDGDAPAAELLEYKAKYEELCEELESFKINYALKSNELERLKKQLHR